MTTTTRVVYSGRVQGVGFRFRTRLLAEHYAVTGYVKNLPDGTVELIAQGHPQEIARFRHGLRTEMGRLIQHEDESGVTDPPRYASFGIAY